MRHWHNITVACFPPRIYYLGYLGDETALHAVTTKQHSTFEASQQISWRQLCDQTALCTEIPLCQRIVEPKYIN